VIYSATKLNASEKNILARMIQLYTYSCGAVLQDLKTLDNRTPRVNALLDKTFVRQNITCRSEIEVPYFSSKCFPNVCCHCGSSDELQIEDGAYPFCPNCMTNKTMKRKHNIFMESRKKKKKKK